MSGGWFVTATGTEVGKTFVTRGLAAAFRAEGYPIAALKPLETGCAPHPSDAHALAQACGRPALIDAPGLYRVPPPLSPYAVTLAGHPPPPAPAALAATVCGLAEPGDTLLVEGAGGLLVPLDRHYGMDDLARALALPLLLVARDGLGVLSHTLTAVESARTRALPLAAVILVRAEPTDADDDPSRHANASILAERLDPLPVIPFPRCADDDARLADAARTSGLFDLLTAA